MSIAGRIREIRKSVSSKMTQADFGKRIGVSREVITSYELSRVVPPEPTLRLICTEFNVDYDWLKYGRGEMFGTKEDAALAAVDDLLNSTEHELTRSLILSLAKMSDTELDVIDALIARIKKEHDI